MKKFKLLLIMAIASVTLVGCSSSKLSDAYDENEVKVSAKEVVQLLNDEDYEGIEALMSDNLKSAASVDDIKAAWQPLKESKGEFDSISKETVVGNEGYATAAVMAKYKNGSVTFTLTFNEELKLEGIYMK